MSQHVSIPSVLALNLFLFFLLFSPLLAQQVCYWPDGTEATTHAPCNSSASNTPTDASSCCHDLAVSYCQSNNLCTWNGAMYRGACTDKTWKSPNCPQQCTGGPSASYPQSPPHSFLSNNRRKILTSPHPAQRNTAMNIYPCPAVGVWECERAGQCSSNFTLPACTYFSKSTSPLLNLIMSPETSFKSNQLSPRVSRLAVPPPQRRKTDSQNPTI